MPGHRIQFAFKGKRKHIAKLNIPNMAYLNEHIDIETPHGSRDLVIVSNTLKITFNLHIESIDKISSIANNVNWTLVKKKTLIFR